MIPIETIRGVWENIFSEYRGTIADVEEKYPNKKSVYLEYDDIARRDYSLAETLLFRPDDVISAGEEVLKNITNRDIHLRITKIIPHEIARINIRDLRAEHLGKFISVEGIVKKATDVKPRLTVGAFQCIRCGAITMLMQDGLSYREPMECDRNQDGCGKTVGSTSFKLIPEKSVFIDTQKLEIQEPPEGLRGGAQPQRLVCYAEDDITGAVMPGDRVVMNGVLRSIIRRERGIRTTFFDIFLSINSIEVEEQEYEEIPISDEEIKEILKISESEDTYEKVVSSIAPSIYGMSIEKEALALQLFGGVRKVLPDGTKVRGDIHILLVGDPGTAKSQLLRYITQISPRGVYATGKAATAAGLTATAVRDEWGEGRWTLEAGALVLADKGIACIDEMDKMSTQDRSAMHEAMEQQTVSVAKAGITSQLQSRCALLAAANPKFGRFDEYKNISEQINLPPALISRFDLIFPIRDIVETERDTQMAKHILGLHYAGEIDAHITEVGEELYTIEDKEKAMKNIIPYIEPDILRKYIAYAKGNVYPVMTKDAWKALEEYYVNLRRQGEGESASVPITPRQLEALVRLTEASARIKLKQQATREDAERAIKIMNRCLEKVFVDYETGRFDVDIIATGISRTQRERSISVMDIIREFASTNPDGASHDDVINEAIKRGIDIEKAEATIQRLKNEGRIYERYSGKYIPV